MLDNSEEMALNTGIAGEICLFSLPVGNISAAISWRKYLWLTHLYINAANVNNWCIKSFEICNTIIVTQIGNRLHVWMQRFGALKLEASAESSNLGSRMESFHDTERPVQGTDGGSLRGLDGLTSRLNHACEQSKEHCTIYLISKVCKGLVKVATSFLYM